MVNDCEIRMLIEVSVYSCDKCNLTEKPKTWESTVPAAFTLQQYLDEFGD